MFTFLTSWEELRPQHPERPPAVFSRLRSGRADLQASRPGIKLVLEGQEVYRIDGRPFPVRPGEFLLVDVGQEIEVQVQGKDEAVGICLNISAEQFSGAMADRLGGLEEPLPFPVIPNIVFGTQGTTLGRTLERLAVAAMNRGGEVMPVEALADPLADLVLAAHGQAGQIGARKPAVRIELLRRAERARSYLHGHLNRSVPLDELAGVAALSKYHLSRSFRQAYGLSPAAYHTKLRLDAVRQMLTREDVSLNELAARFGFADSASLSHAFRRVFGRPPGHAVRLN